MHAASVWKILASFETKYFFLSLSRAITVWSFVPYLICWCLKLIYRSLPCHLVLCFNQVKGHTSLSSPPLPPRLCSSCTVSLSFSLLSFNQVKGQMPAPAPSSLPPSLPLSLPPLSLPPLQIRLILISTLFFSDCVLHVLWAFLLAPVL